MAGKECLWSDGSGIEEIDEDVTERYNAGDSTCRVDADKTVGVSRAEGCDDRGERVVF